MRSALLVGVGLGAVGTGSVAAMALAARALEDGPFAAFATWWTVANLVGLAFFVVEGYLPRLIVSAQAGGAEERDVVASFCRGVVLSAVLLGLLVLGSAPWAVAELFGGYGGLLVLVVVYLGAMCLQSLQRGVAIGREKFNVFAVQMGCDGAVRLVGSAVALWMGARSPVVFAGILCAAAVVGVLAGAVMDREWFAWRRPLASVELAPLGLLLVASLGQLAVNNVGVPWLTAAGEASPRTVGAVAGALTLSRLPTLMVGSAYGPVLTPLARSVDADAWGDFRRFHRTAFLAAVALGAAFTLAFAVVGPTLLELYLGPRFRLPHLEMALMAAGSGLMFVSVVEQAALVALSSFRRVAWAWTAALVGFFGCLLLPVGPALGVSLAVLGAPLIAVVVMFVSRRSLTRDAEGR